MQGAQLATLNGLQLKLNPEIPLANVLQVSAFTLESFFLIRTADQVLLYSLEQPIASITVKAANCWLSHDSQDQFIIALQLEESSGVIDLFKVVDEQIVRWGSTILTKITSFAGSDLITLANSTLLVTRLCSEQQYYSNGECH